MNFFNKIFKISIFAFGIGCFVYEPVVFANSKESSMQTKSDDKKEASSDEKNKKEEKVQQADKKEKLEEGSGTKEFLVEIAGCIVLGLCIGAIKWFILDRKCKC